MKFEVNKMRYYSDPNMEEYERAKIEYFKHLSKIDFSKVPSLLKFYGDAFFHDAEITNIGIDLYNKCIKIEKFRPQDIEDINYFRKEKDLLPITHEEYMRKPVLYVSKFFGLDKIEISKLDFVLKNKISIMDTEIHYEQNKELYRIIFIFGKEIEFSFGFKKCSVIKKNRDFIKKYLDSSKNSIPYCDNCKDRLLNMDKIQKHLETGKYFNVPTS